MGNGDLNWIANYIFLRDTEQIPLQEEGGIEAFLKRELLPCVPTEDG